jgi:hypothetical protein
VAGRKKKCGNLSVFKGRTRHLTKVIFWILAQNPPLVIWDICIAVRKRKGLRYTKYSVVNHRVRTLEKRGYLETSGTRKTHTDSESPLYQLTHKAYLAIILDKTNVDTFLQKADEDEISTALALFSCTL